MTTVCRPSGRASPNLDGVILDHRVGEQLPAHVLDPSARHGGIEEGYQKVARRLGILPEGGSGDFTAPKLVQ